MADITESTSGTFVIEENSMEVSEESKPVDKSEKICRLPLTRIKNIMKMDPDVALASQEAVFLVAKAAELFVEVLAKESYTFTARAKKKVLQRKDVESSIDAVDSFLFLEGTLD